MLVMLAWLSRASPLPGSAKAWRWRGGVNKNLSSSAQPEDSINQLKSWLPNLPMPIAATGVAATGLLSYIYMELRTYEKQIKGLDQKMETQIKGLDQKMETQIKGLDQKMETQIKGLDQKINHLDMKMESQIKGLDMKMETQIKGLDQKINHLDQKIDMLSETLSSKFDALNDFKTQLLIRMEKSEDRVDAQLRELVKRA
ncbi:hypothetical protein KFE25_000017 [Diacronema lutheri]|uniref:Uncharacterized protein n=1 Tax=Diacronema lutheri TaxID=2081491 RepID=A0A8J5XNM9_DIALT|nr:hypothetical protein KFE25_000017 [Diacronema lutheri]